MSIVIVAPHPDDDVIGCGGLMATAAAENERVLAVYVTDGSASHPGSRRFPPHRLAEEREREARLALFELGVTAEPVFMRMPDGGLDALDETRRAAARALIEDVFRRESPRAVFLPWLRDPHGDHRATARIGLDAADAAFGCEAATTVRFYEVWLSITGSPQDAPRLDEAAIETLTLDDDLRARKRRAILAHCTQTAALIDDCEGFRVTPELIERWTGRIERFFCRLVPQHAD